MNSWGSDLLSSGYRSLMKTRVEPDNRLEEISKFKLADFPRDHCSLVGRIFVHSYIGRIKLSLPLYHIKPPPAHWQDIPMVVPCSLVYRALHPSRPSRSHLRAILITELNLSCQQALRTFRPYPSTFRVNPTCCTLLLKRSDLLIVTSPLQC